jgi:fermentation-respiration switch protein FrsA (DUF1100 family)
MKLATIIGSAFGAVGALVGGVWMLQNHLIYFPGPDPGPPPDSWEALTVESGDGVTLTGWVRIDDAPTAQPIVIVFPGNAGNRAGRLPLGNALVAAGFGVVLCEYRGYGGNSGTPGEAGIVADAGAFVRATRERVDTSAGVVYLGESLGAAVAIAVAAEAPPDALVLGSPFTSLADVGRVHYPWLPVDAFLHDRYGSLERIEWGDLDGVDALVIAGTADRVVPVEQSRAVAEALAAPIVEVAGADHNDASVRSSSEMVAEVAAFVREHQNG